MGDIPVEYQSCQKGAHDTLYADGLRQGCRKEHHRQHKDELHDGIRVAAQEIARQLRYQPDTEDTEQGEFDDKEYPEADANVLTIRG